MNSFLDILQHSSEITLPVFLIVFLGWGLKRIGWIDESFIATGSKLVFNLALPALILIKIIEVDLSHVFNLYQVAYGLIATFIGFCIIWQLGKKFKSKPSQRGVFVQGSFRGNLGIIGLALCMNMYGSQGLAIGSILLAFLTLLYNVLSVFALSVPFQDSHRLDIKKLLKGIATNPLIIAIMAGLFMKLQAINLPPILLKSGQYFSSMTLPLALLCVGGAIDLKALHKSTFVSLYATLNKLIFLPTIFTFIGFLMGLKGIYLGTLFLMFASPAATVGFIMAKAMNGDAEMAANIIALSTLLSVFTLSLGILVLKGAGIA